MSDIREILQESIYPKLFERLDTALPEFEFKRSGSGWQSTNSQRINNAPSDNVGTVYAYADNITRLVDHRLGESLSIWDYLQERDSLSKGETLRKLAELAGVQLPKRDLSPEELEAMRRERRRAELLEDVNIFFLNSLSLKGDPYAESTEGKQLQSYVKERGIKLSELRVPGQDYDRKEPKLELGYMPNITALRGYLHSLKKVSKEGEELQESRYSKEDVDSLKSILHNVYGDSHKLTLPYRDPLGRITGFTARNINYKKGDNVGKWVNTIGPKGPYFFNQRLRAEELVIVESPIDAVLATVRGIAGVVAIGGTGINRAQIKTAKRYGAKVVTICLDSDRAGDKGTRKGVDILLEEGLKVFISSLPEGEDPGDVLGKERGAEILKSYLLGGMSVAGYLVELCKRDYDLNLEKLQEDEKTGNTDKVESAFAESLVEAQAKLRDPIDIQYFYIYADKAGIPQEILGEKAKELRQLQDEERKRKEIEATLRQGKSLLAKGDPDEAYNYLENQLREIRRTSSGAKLQDLLEPVSRDSLIKHIKEAPPSMETSYKYTNGESIKLPAGALSLLAAPTSHGKTSVAINFTIDLALRYPDKQFYFFSYEESAEAITLLFLNAYLDMHLSKDNLGTLYSYYKEDSIKFFDAGVNIEDFKKKEEAFFKLLSSGRINIHYVAWYSEELVDTVYELKYRTNVGAVFVDYLQELDLTDSERKSRQEQLKKICKQLKNVSVDTGLPLILGAQFNREVKKESDLSELSLREAADIEQSANLILGIYNRTKSNDKPVENTLYIKTLKYRFGNPNLEAELPWNGNRRKVGSTPQKRDQEQKPKKDLPKTDLFK